MYSTVKMKKNQNSKVVASLSTQTGAINNILTPILSGELIQKS
jgi:hypothetical protein